MYDRHPADPGPRREQSDEEMSATFCQPCHWGNSFPTLQCNLLASGSHSSLCILHDPDENKDLEIFNEALEAKIENESKPGVMAVNLSGVVFPTLADFSRRIFKTPMRFSFARFYDGAIFDTTEFSARASFDHVTFCGGTSFLRTKFIGEATFTDAVFYWGQNIFDEAEFWEEAAFSGAEFNDMVFLAGRVS